LDQFANEDVKNIIRINSTNFNKQIILPNDAISIQDSFQKFFPFKDKECYMGLENLVGQCNLKLDAKLGYVEENHRFEIKRCKSHR
jgi:hypothetical protein